MSRLVMTVFWAAAAVTLQTRSLWAADDGLGFGLPPRNVEWMTWAATVFALYNAVRWLAARRNVVRSDLTFRERVVARRRPDDAVEKRNPDFDFTKPADPAP